MAGMSEKNKSLTHDTDGMEDNFSNNSALPQERLHRVFTELLPSNDRGIHRQTHRLSFDKTKTA
jgi:hypothetical protein